MVGWAALSPVSRRACYAGVVEKSVYVAEDARGEGVGEALLSELVDRSGRGRDLDDPGVDLPGERREHRAAPALRLPGRRHARADRADSTGSGGTPSYGKEEAVSFVKIEAVVIRERIETVIDAVEEHAGHVGVTVIEAVGHGRQRGITHEYRGRVFESRFLPKALLVFVGAEDRMEAIVERDRRRRPQWQRVGRRDRLDDPDRERDAQPTGRALEEVEVAA